MSWLAPPDGKPGRPAVFSDAAIQFWLNINVLFKLPLRQTTGMVASLLQMAKGGQRGHHPSSLGCATMPVPLDVGGRGDEVGSHA